MTTPEGTTPVPHKKKGRKRWLTLAAVLTATALDVALATDVIPTVLREVAHELRDAARRAPLLADQGEQSL